MRWNALPPTLVITCKSSDFSGYVGTVWEVKVIQLDDAILSHQRAGGSPARYDRVKK